MDTRNQGERAAHSAAFHERHLSLFDAYTTNELGEVERVQVEQNLQSCQECQHLFTEVTHLRSVLGTLSETENPSVPVQVSHSPQMLQAILERIEPEKNRAKHPTTIRVRQTQTPFRSPGEYSPAILAQKRTRSIYLGIGAALCCVLLLGGFMITLRNTLPSARNKTIAPQEVWMTEQQSMLVQNNVGIFALKKIEIITRKEFHFYYAFQSSHQDTLHVVAISSQPTGQEQPVTLSATVLPLGTIDGINVGVIRVQYLDRVGQTITLNITSPKEGDTRWQLTPLKQLEAEPHPEGGGFYGFPVDRHLFPKIIWSGPFSEPSEQSKISLFKNATGTRYIFLEVDYAGEVKVITREQCIQLFREQICH